MDEMVLRAMLKWPHVPHCYGWLGLDGKGNWYMRDDAAQAAGPFAVNGLLEPRSKGSLLRHAKLIEFIGRNYAADEEGRWYFQNGPQRVYVELSHAPWVWRLTGGNMSEARSHTGSPTEVICALTDDKGLLYLETALGLGLVHSQDMDQAADALVAGCWPLEEVRASDLPGRFGFVRSPASGVRQATSRPG